MAKKRKKKSLESRTSTSKYRKVVLTRATEGILNDVVIGVEYPGGRSRESYRMLLESGRSVIATRRNELELAQLEIQILHALGDHQVPVPRLLGNNHSHILIQEYVSGTRLSQALKDADEQQCHRLLDAALDSLAAIQHAATASDLETKVEALGYEDSWISGLIKRPKVIGEFLGVPAPSLDESALINQLRMREPRFIKWDARPGNALVNGAGQVVWFDWEHAGKRNRLDDAAWILGDEYVPEFPEVEKRLLDAYVLKFAGPMSDTESREYLMCYGTFHMVVRLGLILKYMTGKWWDLDECIEEDKVGVTLSCAQRLCRRGARWSGQCELTQELSPWFEKIEKKIERL
ncbi:MAG: hypothetical protein ACJAZF_004621 [Granulosicoccus sp.]